MRLPANEFSATCRSRDRMSKERKGVSSRASRAIKARPEELYWVFIEVVRFVSTDPAFSGEMTMTATFDDVPGGTHVTRRSRTFRPDLRAEDNEAGSRSSLEQLAR